MLRLVGFFLGAVLLASVLGHVPIIGPLFARTGCIGIWIAAMILSWAVTKYGERAYRVRRDGAEVRRLRAVNTPHTHGKLGSLFLAQGRPKKALVELEVAAAGEPEVAEWHYRLGCARLELKRYAEAVEALERCVELAPEHAYGGAEMRLAEALFAAGDASGALGAVEVFERNHGPSPESAYRRGLALKATGSPEKARLAFQEVGQLASNVARYQRQAAGIWSMRAKIASFF